MQQATRAEKIALAFALFISSLYFIRLDADTISGLFGIYWMDEMVYLLAAKNQALFGTAHPFPQDQWLPEIRTPLIHYIGVLIMGATKSIVPLRAFCGLCILGAAAIMARVAAQYHGNRFAGLICYICIIINPLLFFYGRIAFSEDVQFLLFTVALALLFQLQQTKDTTRAVKIAAASGALGGIIFVSKISALAACIGLGTGMLLTIWLHPALPGKHKVIAIYALAGIATLAAYFLGFLHGQFDDWWRLNIAGNQASAQTPGTIGYASQVFIYKIVAILVHFCLMPIFAIYFLSLAMTADRKKGYLFILFAITVVIFCFESLYGPTLRRNVFSLAMLSILFGFTCSDYVKHGVRASWRGIGGLGSVLIAIQVLGAGYFVLMSVLSDDSQYFVLGSTFLLVMLLATLAWGERHIKARQLLMGLIILATLAPMLFQAFLTPKTRLEADKAIESATPEDAVILGMRSPVYFQGNRRTVMTNCRIVGAVPIDYANEIDRVKLEGHYYYLTHLLEGTDPCTPADRTYYHRIGRFNIFNPENGGLEHTGKSIYWQYRQEFLLYEKRN